MATTTPQIDLENFARRQKEGARVLDVREPGEYVEGYSVAGGTQGWAESGRPLVTGRDPGDPA
ncbi:MAG TPA: hypothetical protein VFI99_14555 [Nocardioides sp.]|jgi:rhodanese-related sulfurtransferase|nr:hypothetical protein [Nocardioides sp.]